MINPGDTPSIRSLKPSHYGREDGHCWIHTKSELYTVKSGYKLASQMKEESTESLVLKPNTNLLKSLIWKLKTTRKIKHFIWLSFSGCLASCSRLVDRYCGIDRSCPRCGDSDESINYILLMCPPTLQTWAPSTIPTAPGVFPSESLFDNMDYLLLRAKNQESRRMS